MSQKMECRACASYTTAITSALRDGEPCPYCGADLITGRALAAASLTDFLLARIAEDEEVARSFTYNWSDPQESLRRRFIADCEAKRRIVGQVIDLDQHDGYTEATRDAVLALAAVYAGHPDYREEWKP